jgi:integrase
MRKTAQNGYIMRHRGWWVLRYRERVGTGGELKTVQRAKRLAPIDSDHKTKASVKKIAEDLLQPLNRGSFSPMTVTTIGDFCERIYLVFVKEHKRASTHRGYLQMWDNYLKERCGKHWLRETKTCDIQVWLETIAREAGISKTTLRHIKHFLSGLFRYAAQQDYWDAGRANPVHLAAIPASAPKGCEGQAYTFEEVQQMLNVLLEPAATVVTVAAFTGLRLGELKGLVWEAYTPAPDKESLGLLYVTRSIWRNVVGDPKTEKSKAPVPVIPQIAERLATHRKMCGNPFAGPIFVNSLGRPLDLDGLYQRSMREVLQKAGIQWKGWHGFRRGLASNLNRLGVDDSIIQGILRHSTVVTTQNHYIKTVRADAVAAMRRLSEALECSNRTESESKIRLIAQ